MFMHYICICTRTYVRHRTVTHVTPVQTLSRNELHACALPRGREPHLGQEVRAVELGEVAAAAVAQHGGDDGAGRQQARHLAVRISMQAGKKGSASYQRI